jgi:hypothetical protein
MNQQQQEQMIAEIIAQKKHFEGLTEEQKIQE